MPRAQSSEIFKIPKKNFFVAKAPQFYNSFSQAQKDSLKKQKHYNSFSQAQKDSIFLCTI